MSLTRASLMRCIPLFSPMIQPKNPFKEDGELRVFHSAILLFATCAELLVAGSLITKLAHRLSVPVKLRSVCVLIAVLALAILNVGIFLLDCYLTRLKINFNAVDEYVNSEAPSPQATSHLILSEAAAKWLANHPGNLINKLNEKGQSLLECLLDQIKKHAKREWIFAQAQALGGNSKFLLNYKRYTPEQVKMLSCLLGNGADPKLTDLNGKSLLQRMLKGEEPTLYSICLSLCARVDYLKVIP